MPRRRLIFACMTGTSLDGLDAAAVRVSGERLELTGEVVAFTSAPFGSLADPLRSLMQGEPTTAGIFARIAHEFGELHADVLTELRRDAGAPDLIAIPGQTLLHAPPLSLQLINPWPVARRFDAPIVYDFRSADLAKGGQGAPITPIADWMLFRSDSESRAIINLGGFANITILPKGADTAAIAARDVCACNHVLDAVAREGFGEPYDKDGAVAARGTPDPEGVRDLLETFPAPHERRALGDASPALEWVKRRLHQRGIAGETVAASAVDAIARRLADAAAEADHLLLAGGSVRNRALVEAIARHAGKPVDTTAALGVDPLQREVVAIALLAALCQDGVPITLPQVTGVASPAPLAGAWIHPCPTSPHPGPHPTDPRPA